LYGLYDDDCFFDIHCVLVTQVNDQKIQRQLTVGVFFSYKSVVVNYRWGILVFYLCLAIVLYDLETLVAKKLIFMHFCKFNEREG